jgi:long-subunit fatty acid transport protein
MRFQNITALGLVATIGAVSPHTAIAGDVTDLYFQQAVERYFEYSQNARTFGMAGSSVQTSTDSSSVLGNPAGLGLMPQGEFSATYSYNTISGDEFPTNFGVDQTSNMASGMLALPLSPVENDLPRYGNLGLAWTTSDSNWHDDTFDTRSERNQIVAAYSYGVSKTLSFGYSIGWTDDKFQSREIFNYPMGDGFRHTLGAHWKQSPSLSFASALTVGHGNRHALYGPGITGDSDILQVGFDTGLEYSLENKAVIALGLDYRHLSSDGEVVTSIPANFVGGDENGNIYNIRLGVEYPVSEMIDLRAGYRFAGLESYKYNRVELNDLNGSANYSALSLGAGVKFPVAGNYIESVNLDYGVEYREVGEGDWQHVVTVSVPFGLCS